ncbi:MAG: DUF1573 domain-containing protein [Cytophagales bacterium]|nr:DUF1573 domain-containing protein [Cytophagales bacterium]
MKYTLLASFIWLGSMTSLAQADFKFDKTEHDFGSVVEKDDTLWCEFKFKNVGVEPLIISDIKTACECTLADFSKKPVMPGQYGIVKAGYKYKGKPGNFNKALTIMANTVPAVTMVSIKGVILEQKK